MMISDADIEEIAPTVEKNKRAIFRSSICSTNIIYRLDSLGVSDDETREFPVDAAQKPT
jgi:hypothetical protein